MTDAATELNAILRRNPDLRIDDATAQSVMAEVSAKVGQDVTAETVSEYKATEADVQANIIRTLTLDGWLALRVNGGAMQVDGRYVEFARWFWRGVSEAAGHADVIAAKGGRVLFIECKRKGGKQRDSQVRFMDACEDTGNAYVIARSVDDVVPFLERVTT